jgi:hypothetical protein
MLADTVRVFGWYSVQYSTDIDVNDVAQHQRPRRRGFGLRVQYLGGKARDNVVTMVTEAVAPRESPVPRVEACKGKDDRKDPIQGRQCEYEGDEGEQPFPCSTLESIGAGEKSVRKSLR